MYILIIILHMKLGGDVVSTQEFSSVETCFKAAAYVNENIENATFKCLPK